MELRALILQADQLAREKGLNQKKWSDVAGYAKNGQTVSRIMSKGDCRMSTFLSLLKPLGAELRIVRVDGEGAENPAP
jgi:hypothetical protein